MSNSQGIQRCAVCANETHFTAFVVAFTGRTVVLNGDGRLEVDSDYVRKAQEVVLVACGSCGAPVEASPEAKAAIQEATAQATVEV